MTLIPMPDIPSTTKHFPEEFHGKLQSLSEVRPSAHASRRIPLLRLQLRGLGAERRDGSFHQPEQFHLTPAQIGLMVSVPTLAGAFMRFPLGVLSQYIGRKNAAIVEMSAIVIALLYGFFFVHTFNDVLAMGVLLGIAGASFGVALSLGSGWFPKQVQGTRHGHRRSRQQRHRPCGPLRSAAGARTSDGSTSMASPPP